VRDESERQIGWEAKRPQERIGSLDTLPERERLRRLAQQPVQHLVRAQHAISTGIDKGRHVVAAHDRVMAGQQDSRRR
jgi:hypothetical protein